MTPPAHPWTQQELPGVLRCASLALMTWLHMPWRQRLNFPGLALSTGDASAQGSTSMGFQDHGGSP